MRGPAPPRPASQAYRRPDTSLPSELDGEHIAVGDDVVAALNSQQAAIARTRVAPGVDEVGPADDLRPHEALLDVGMDLAGGLPRRASARQRPGRRLFPRVGREERDQVEQA